MMRYQQNWRRLASVLAVCMASAHSAWGATATYSEEMTAPPDPNKWGWVDDGGSSGVWSDPADTRGSLETLASFDGAAGVWRIPNGDFNMSDSGMALAEPGAAGAQRPNLIDTPVKGPEMTYEVRYRINTSRGIALDTNQEEVINWPTTGTGAFSAFPIQFNVTGNHPSIPGWRIWIGYNNGDGDGTTDGYYVTHMNEGIGAFGGALTGISPGTAGPPPFDTWQTLRMTEQYDPAGGGTGEINVYLNGNATPIATFDLTGVPPFPCCSRSLGIQRNGGGSTQGGSNPDPKWVLSDYLGMEVAFDYIRIVDRVIPITEALNAPGVGGCAGNLNGDGTTDGADVAIIYNNWNTNNALADINDDGSVDGADLGIVFNCWNQADTPGVPEPASFGMLGVGFIAMLAARRRA